MRTVYLLPLAAMVAAVAGCSSQGREQAALSLPQRDLTLAAQAREVDIASPVELGSLRAQHRTMRASRTLRLRAARRSTPVEDKYAPAAVAATPAIVLTVAHSAAQPAAVAAVPASDRELLPGKTVTVIPASNGPSNSAEGSDEFPTTRVGGGGSVMGGGGSGMGGGGRCPGRGPGIGIAGVPQPDFR